MIRIPIPTTTSLLHFRASPVQLDSTAVSGKPEFFECSGFKVCRLAQSSVNFCTPFCTPHIPNQYENCLLEDVMVKLYGHKKKTLLQTRPLDQGLDPKVLGLGIVRVSGVWGSKDCSLQSLQPKPLKSPGF